MHPLKYWSISLERVSLSSLSSFYGKKNALVGEVQLPKPVLSSQIKVPPQNAWNAPCTIFRVFAISNFFPLWHRDRIQGKRFRLSGFIDPHQMDNGGYILTGPRAHFITPYETHFWWFIRQFLVLNHPKSPPLPKPITNNSGLLGFRFLGLTDPPVTRWLPRQETPADTGLATQGTKMRQPKKQSLQGRKPGLMISCRWWCDGIQSANKRCTKLIFIDNLYVYWKKWGENLDKKVLKGSHPGQTTSTCIKNIKTCLSSASSSSSSSLSFINNHHPSSSSSTFSCTWRDWVSLPLFMFTQVPGYDFI